MSTTPADEEPLAREISAIHDVLDEVVKQITDIEKRAALVARVATAGIQAARTRHTISNDRTATDALMAMLASLDNDARAPTEQSAGAPGRDDEPVGEG